MWLLLCFFFFVLSLFFSWTSHCAMRFNSVEWSRLCASHADESLRLPLSVLYFSAVPFYKQCGIHIKKTLRAKKGASVVAMVWFTVLEKPTYYKEELPVQFEQCQESLQATNIITIVFPVKCCVRLLTLPFKREILGKNIKVMSFGKLFLETCYWKSRIFFMKILRLKRDCSCSFGVFLRFSCHWWRLPSIEYGWLWDLQVFWGACCTLSSESLSLHG